MLDNPHRVGPFQCCIAGRMDALAFQCHLHGALGHCPHFRPYEDIAGIFRSVLNEDIPATETSPTNVGNHLLQVARNVNASTVLQLATLNYSLRPTEATTGSLKASTCFYCNLLVCVAANLTSGV